VAITGVSMSPGTRNKKGTSMRGGCVYGCSGGNTTTSMEDEGGNMVPVTCSSFDDETVHNSEFISIGI